MTQKTASLCLQVTQDTERYVNKLTLRIRQLSSLNSSHHTVCPGWGFPSIRHSFQANVTRVLPFRYHNPPTHQTHKHWSSCSFIDTKHDTICCWQKAGSEGLKSIAWTKIDKSSSSYMACFQRQPPERKGTRVSEDKVLCFSVKTGYYPRGNWLVTM